MTPLVVRQLHHLHVHVGVCAGHRGSTGHSQAGPAHHQDSTLCRVSKWSRTEALAHEDAVHLGDRAVVQRANHLVVALANRLEQVLVRALLARHVDVGAWRTQERTREGRS